MKKYGKALVEVDEVLSRLSNDELNKIPQDVRDIIKQYKDKEYVWEYNENMPLTKQNLSRDAVILLSYLNMEYLLNKEQKALLRDIHMLNEKKLG